MMLSCLDSDRYSSVTYCLEMSFKVLYSLDLYHCQVSLQHGFFSVFRSVVCLTCHLVTVLTGIYVSHSDGVSTTVDSTLVFRGALQIQDWSPQSRPVVSECVCDWWRDATSPDCDDRSWICNAT